MKEIKAIIQPFMLTDVLHALEEIESLPGVTVSHLSGWGKTKAREARATTTEGGHRMAQKTKLEIVVADDMVDTVVSAIAKAAHTGQFGDGKIFVSEIAEIVKIRTGDRGDAAI